MSATAICGFEAQALLADGWIANGGSPGYSTSIHRTGAASLHINPASGSAMAVSHTIALANFLHFGLYATTLPSVDRIIAGNSGAGLINLRLTSTGAIKVFIATTLIGTSTTTLTTGSFYWIGMRQITGTSVVFLQINGGDEVTGTATVSGTTPQLGCPGTEASAIDINFDDMIGDDTGFLAPSNVALLVPTADSAKGTGWTNDAATTTNLFNAVDNEPPVGIADTSASTGLHQIRNATSNANVNYDATMTTYTAAGVGASDTVLGLVPLCCTAAPVTTSSKQGTVGIVSNPTVANVALGPDGTSGAFWAGVAGGTFPTGWKVSFGTMTASPSVTLGTAPVMRVTQVTASTRIAVVCFMGIYVAWTPAAVASFVPYRSPLVQLVPQ